MIRMRFRRPSAARVRLQHAGPQQAGPVVQAPVATPGTVLAVTSEELALVGYRLHKVALTAEQVILRMPRGEVKTALLGRGWHGVVGTAPSPLTIVLVNGDTWRLEVFGIDKRRAKAVVRALTAGRPVAGIAGGAEPGTGMVPSGWPLA